MAHLANQFVQNGRYLDYTPGADVVAGTAVVLAANLLGIAPNDIAANVLGALDTEGVYEMTKTNIADVFAIGNILDFDGTGVVITAAGNVAGKVVKASGNGDSVVWVKIND